MRLALKAAILFIAANLVWGWADPSGIARLSAYNYLFPGRERFPFGESPQLAYNFSVDDLQAMFASHRISGEEVADGELRIVVLGDSSVWGALLRPQETLSARLAAELPARCGRPARVFNLGYPTLSLFKDLLILQRAANFEPDLIVWVTTLEAFARDNQLASPVAAANRAEAREAIARYDLALHGDSSLLAEPPLWDRTFIGRRRALADLVRLQLYGVLWSATGIDQVYPADLPRAQTDLSADVSFHGSTGPALDESQLAFDVLDAGVQAAGSIPVLVVNEPVLISRGTNSQVRYNFYYPRWAFDQYRQMMVRHALPAAWGYLDLWNLIPGDQFTNTAMHLTPKGESLMAERVASAVAELACQ